MSDIDLELGHRQESADGSLCSYSDEGMSCCSHFYSTAGGSYDDYSLDPEISGEASSSGRALSASEDEMEAELAQIKVAKMERECRICHLGLENSGHEVGAVIQLGCSCKDDLGAAHQNCAETWFKIKGNKDVGRNRAPPHCCVCSSLSSGDPTTRAPPVLARPPLPQLLARVHGVCIRYFVAVPLQCSVVEPQKHFNGMAS